MREIEYRGKRQENGEWIFGSLLIDEIQNSICIVDNKEGIGYEVEPETVGQYTGLKDKNGKKIYGGDIVDFSYDVFVGNFDTKVAKGIVKFEKGAFWIEIPELKEQYLLYEVNIDTIEVIGNVTDNLELLEGE